MLQFNPTFKKYTSVEHHMRRRISLAVHVVRADRKPF
jgi:hypothetical protein